MLRQTMLIVANWKMHGDSARIRRWMDAVSAEFAHDDAIPECVLCPPFLWLESANAHLGDSKILKLGGQDCRAEAEGPFTGDISARMLAKVGARYVIVGHSERRIGHRETSVQVAEKCRSAKHAGLTPIVCVGETLAERESGRALDVVREQLAHSIAGGDAWCIVAYEPVWAIGTGHTPSLEEIAAMHREISAFANELQQSRDRDIPVVYGGSVNPSNAASILAIPEVQGALIGSASLEHESYIAIARAAQKVMQGK